MTIDLSTQLAAWKAGSLKERPTKALLGRLERAHKAAVEKILESPVKTQETKRLEQNELRRNFRSEWNRMRGEIIAGMDEEIEAAKAKSNPPATNEELQRMSLLSGVHLPVWQRSPGNLVADAVAFEQQGDEAGLKLARRHVGVLGTSQRSKAAASIDEALSDLKTEDQLQASRQVRTLEGEREQFELGTGMRQSGMIRAMSDPLPPPTNAPSPMAVPQR